MNCSKCGLALPGGAKSCPNCGEPVPRSATPSAQLLDFSQHIADHAKDFTGREWVFREIDKWLADANAARFFIITGAPASGKTAIAAMLTRLRDLAAYHFCVASQSNTLNSLEFCK
jgi:hypothetical protein